MKEDQKQVEKEEEALVWQQQLRKNVWKRSKENQREECGGSGTDSTEFKRTSEFRIGESGKETEGESLEPDKIASGGVEISAAGTFRN